MELRRFEEQFSGEKEHQEQEDAAKLLHKNSYVSEMEAHTPDAMQVQFKPGQWQTQLVPAWQVAVYQLAYRAAFEEHKDPMAQEILQRAENARRN